MNIYFQLEDPAWVIIEIVPAFKRLLLKDFKVGDVKLKHSSFGISAPFCVSCL